MTNIMTPNNIKQFTGLRRQTAEQPSGLCVGIYGQGGGGKTTVFGNAVLSPHCKPMAYFDVEGGSRSIRHLEKEGIDFYDLTSWKELETAVKQIENEDHGYKSIAWDNLSEIQAMCLKNIRPVIPFQIQDYSIMQSRMLEFTRKMRDISRTTDISMFFALWEEIEQDSLTQLVRNKVNLTPKLSAAWTGVIPMLGRLTVPRNLKGLRLLSFAPADNVDSKYNIGPTTIGASIPKDLYLKEDATVIADMLATLRDNVPFPVSRYAKPANG